LLICCYNNDCDTIHLNGSKRNSNMGHIQEVYNLILCCFLVLDSTVLPAGTQSILEVMELFCVPHNVVSKYWNELGIKICLIQLISLNPYVSQCVQNYLILVLCRDKSYTNCILRRFLLIYQVMQWICSQSWFNFLLVHTIKFLQYK